MASDKLKHGAEGEERAARALKKARYRIVERNFRTPAGEIDIVAHDGKCLVFVEVKTRSSIEFGLPQEAVVLRPQQAEDVASFDAGCLEGHVGGLRPDD